MCTHKNRLIEATLMSTHNIHFQDKIIHLKISVLYYYCVMYKTIFDINIIIYMCLQHANVL